MAAPPSEVVRVHASSGTTGNPTIVGYTRRDLSIWSEVMSRCLSAYGVTRDDTFSVSYGYGLFTGGLGAHYGVENLGATVIPASTGNTEKHVRLIRDLHITGIACTPSYALYLAEVVEKMGIRKEELGLRIGAFGAEPWTENMRQEIQNRLGLKGYNIYGLSEIMGRVYLTNVRSNMALTSTKTISIRKLSIRLPWNLFHTAHRRTGIYHIDQRGHAVVALPYEGPDFADCRCVSVRSYQCAYDADYGPKR